MFFLSGKAIRLKKLDSAVSFKITHCIGGLASGYLQSVTPFWHPIAQNLPTTDFIVGR
jgi:hypothetical protein